MIRKINKNNKMNGLLLEVEALSRCAKSMSAMIDDAASFKSIFDILQQPEEEEQAGRAEQQRSGDLLSDAEGSVASEGQCTTVLRLPCPLLTCFGQKRCTAAPKFTRDVWALLRAL
jgi:hypothetical protein